MPSKARRQSPMSKAKYVCSPIALPMFHSGSSSRILETASTILEFLPFGPLRNPSIISASVVSILFSKYCNPRAHYNRPFRATWTLLMLMLLRQQLMLLRQQLVRLMILLWIPTIVLWRWQIVTIGPDSFECVAENREALSSGSVP